MACGAVWLQQPSGGMNRIRRATAGAKPGDLICLYYDPTIIDLKPPQAHLVHDEVRYSIWFKPAGLLTQGTKFGDHCSLERQIQLHFHLKRKILLVHRIDREARGLVLVCHDRQAAAGFADLFRNQQIEKNYQIKVRGDLGSFQKCGRIDFPLNGRAATTSFETLHFDTKSNTSTVRVRLHSGRTHQIRRHFYLQGFPVIGDPRYGTNNKNKQGLQLVAYRVGFSCPLSGRNMEIMVDPDEGY
jgi:tRNA pseudouridine32 synthase/23S rRNA pseudouridine746 synthase